MAPVSRRIDTERVNDVTVVKFATRRILDEHTTLAISDELFRLVDGSPRRILVSFSDLDYLSSSMLRLLLKVQERVEADGGRLVLCNMAPSIRDLFKVTTLDRLFDICDWSAEADPQVQLEGVWSRARPRPSRKRSADSDDLD